MDYSRSLLKFLKVVLVFTSIYWCILLFLILESGSSSQLTSDRDGDANSRASPLMIGHIIVLSVCGGALVILLAAFHLLSQHYKESGHLLSQHYKESGKFKSINCKLKK
jgi:hypothetical protein